MQFLCLPNLRLIALSGADFSASINGEAVPHLHAIIVGKNDVLQFHKPAKKEQELISLSGGGLVINKWMNSCSTHLKAKAGGYNGRTLLKDDELIFT